MDEITATDCFAALGHPTRLQLFRALVRAGDDGAPVGILQDELGIPASTLSHHVQALTRAGLAYQQRDGRVLTTRVDYATMQDLISFLTESCCKGLEPGTSTDE